MAATADLHDRLMTDVATLVQSLNLTQSSGATGDVGQNVVVQWQGERLNLPAYPAVVVSCEGESEEVTTELSSTEYQGTTYPVEVRVVDEARADFQTARLDYLAWRRAIRNAVNEKTNNATPPATSPPSLLPNCPECSWSLVRPLKIEPGVRAQQQVVAALMVECVCFEART